MVHYAFPHPSADDTTAGMPGKVAVETVPLTPWTWSKPDILDQLAVKAAASAALGARKIADDPPPEDQFAVTPIPYNTGFKAGQLIKLHFPPLAKSSFI